MENNTIELSLMDPEERELVSFIYNAIFIGIVNIRLSNRIRNAYTYE